jgi:hypothetical protein
MIISNAHTPAFYLSILVRYINNLRPKIRRSFSGVNPFRKVRVLNIYPLTSEDVPDYILNSKKPNIRLWMENLL